MKNTGYLEEVRNQYERFPYPSCNPDDEKRRFYATHAEHLDMLNFCCFSGKKDFSKGFRTLVAGGGTGNAAITLAEQLRDTDALIVYLDISQASMAIAQERARLRGLTNIVWKSGSILDIPQLELGEFDYINCMGVLHHLADPDAGLAALSSALKDDGAMGIMVYAKYGRTAIYQIQELLRFINCDEDDMDVKVRNCKAVLSSLPKDHWFNLNRAAFEFEINSGDAGIYDLFLHSQDRAYSVPELYGFVEGAGLRVSRFLSTGLGKGNRLYDPESYITDDTLLSSVRRLDIRGRQSAAELLNGQILTHTVYVSKQAVLPASIDNLDFVPCLSINFPEDAYDVFYHVARKATGTITMGPPGQQISFPKTRHAEVLIKHMDGNRSTKEIFDKVMRSVSHGKKPTYPQLLDEMRAIFLAMNIHDWMLLRSPSVKPYQLVGSIQARVSKMY
jgi:2-polyprenyl-3-methyl-5-hydroxy-6-metoxy-1,4-benzoquinol methylase